jgi:hypothetical protein
MRVAGLRTRTNGTSTVLQIKISLRYFTENNFHNRSKKYFPSWQQNPQIKISFVKNAYKVSFREFEMLHIVVDFKQQNTKNSNIQVDKN